MKKKHRGKKCPECGSDSIMPIVYGLIDDPEAIKQIEDGEFSTGGCCIECMSSNEFVPRVDIS